MSQRLPIAFVAKFRNGNRGILKIGNNPNRLKKTFHKALTTAQWSRRWSADSPFLLHIQHLSTTMIRCFLRLSMVRIFHTGYRPSKKSSPQWNLSPPNTFKGKRKPTLQPKTLQKDLTLNIPLYKGTHQSLSSLTHVSACR
jgi:hypothetical protein